MKPRIEAIVAHRRLLDASIPEPGLGRTLVDALGTALMEAASRHRQACDTERQRLEGTESRRTIGQKAREAILAGLRIENSFKGAIGTEQEALESVERISLDDWRIRSAALPQCFWGARVEPKIRHMKLGRVLFASLRKSEPGSSSRQGATFPLAGLLSTWRFLEFR